jgi:2-methylisocitrate lyase-like PEP mutase family enzyme
LSRPPSALTTDAAGEAREDRGPHRHSAAARDDQLFAYARGEITGGNLQVLDRPRARALIWRCGRDSRRRMTIADRRRSFRALHERGCFVIPNPWDVGTTRYLEQLGFPAVATTSAGAAFSAGLPDTAVTRDAMLAHIRALVAATELPVNADFERGFADAPDAVAENVRLCVETGVAGLSIEDARGHHADAFYDVATAAARIAAARRAIDATDPSVVLTGRAECFLFGETDVAVAIERLRAYADAGADCLYAPGIRTRDDIAAVVAAVAPKPVNVLVAWPSELTVEDLAALGVRRVSVGSALARVAWGAFMRAAQEIAKEGRFDRLGDAVTFFEIDAFFRDDVERRGR